MGEPRTECREGVAVPPGRTTDPQSGPQEGACQSCPQGPGPAACSPRLGRPWRGGPLCPPAHRRKDILGLQGPRPLSRPALRSHGVEARGASSPLEMAVWTQTSDTGVPPPQGGWKTRESWGAWGGWEHPGDTVWARGSLSRPQGPGGCAGAHLRGPTVCGAQSQGGQMQSRCPGPGIKR